MPKTKPAGSFKHPLTDFVLSAFTPRNGHDRITLADFLGAPGYRSPKGVKAYQTVADDVLKCLESEGLLFRDEAGWYYRTDQKKR